MFLQLGKAEQVVSTWGIGRRQLAYWVDTGLIEAERVGRGKGNIRALTVNSLLDAYLASYLTQELATERAHAAIVEARRHYNHWLEASPEKVTFEIHSAAAIAECVVSVAVPIRPAIHTILALSASPQTFWDVERGRHGQKGNWRMDFRNNLAEIGEALRVAAASRPSLEEDIAAYRSERSGHMRETRVTVSP